jgi:uncharacterized phage protein (TIGR01671 family)
MNREIKFRAWDTELSIMGVPFTPFDSQFLSSGGTFSEGTIFMQYTGLKDSKGVEIYEGDVVYLAGYGDYIVEFPFIQLYESSHENDIGSIKGNIFTYK